MKITARLLAAPAVLALALAACSSPSENAEQSPSAAEATSEPAAEESTPSDEELDELDAAAEAGEGEEPMVYEQGDFTATNETGAVFTVHVPAEAPADIEEYREAMGQEPVGYISIDIDNSAGTDTAGPSDVHLVDADGNQYTYTSAFGPIGDWSPSMKDDGPEGAEYYYVLPDGTEISEEEYLELNDQGMTLYDKYLENNAMPGAKVTAWYIGPAPVPEQMVYVEVQEALMPYPAEPAA